MPLDEFGKPYVGKCDSQNNTIHVSPESDGWVDELTATFCIGRVPIYLPNPKQPSVIQKKEAYVLRTYRIKPKTCQYCRDQKENYDYVKLMSPIGGVYWRCFRGIYGAFGNSDLVQQFNDIDNKYTKNCYELIEEQYVYTQSEILKLFLKGEINVIMDMELIHFIEKRTGKKL